MLISPLRFPLWLCDSTRRCAGVRALADEKSHEHGSLSLREPEDNTVNSAISIPIFQCQNVNLPARQQAHYTRAFKGHGQLNQNAGLTPHQFLALLARENILN